MRLRPVAGQRRDYGSRVRARRTGADGVAVGEDMTKEKMRKIMVFVNELTYAELTARKGVTGASLSVQIRLIVEASLSQALQKARK
jgi:hypothetical protein